ncbi:MAG: flavin prenyltransferase UbiX [Thermodesulfobacteriota bacterium]|nr:MAG: flavin prenyltransferase UbiX [Thermodesulfobacteriota bacterium]
MAAYIVALTGASGAVYGLRLIDELLKGGYGVDMTASPTGLLIMEHELGLDVKEAGVLEAVRGYLKEERRRAGEAGATVKSSGPKGVLNYYPAHSIAAPMASGSSLARNMVVCPCSMGTLSRISTGASSNLIERAADCVLKERGRLVLVPRETPLNSIHLENMLRLSRSGAVVLPAMPGFYSKPSTIDELIDFIVGKVLDVLGIENSLFKRWEG